MKWLLNKPILTGVQQRLEAGTRLLLFLSYDSIVKTQAGGAGTPLPSDLREQLRELSEFSFLTLIILSDHALEVLKKLVGFSGIYFIANNGLEIFGPDLNVVHAEAKRTSQALVKMSQTLKRRLADFQEVKYEDRGLSLVVNLAQAKPADQRRARLVMEELWTPVMDTFTLQEKNYELTLRPRVGWGKGRAAMFLWNKFASPRRRPLVVYVGTDESDEEIFGFMGREGMGVVVGNEKRIGKTKASYYLKSRAEVGRLIHWLLQNRFHLPTSGSTA